MKTLYTAAHRLADIVNDNPQILMVMSRFDISMGFADKTVGQVCVEQGVDTATFLAVANFVASGHVSLDGVKLPALMEYLKNAHRYFVDFCLPLIRRKLIEAIDCRGDNKIGMLIVSFYDEYTEEVKRHMDYENTHVFTYADHLLAGVRTEGYSIETFARGHRSIHDKLQELKNIIIRYLPQRGNDMLGSALFDIINCEQDLANHCAVEDRLFVPLTRTLEESVKAEATRPKPAATAPSATAEQLSAREREIVACMARGLQNKEIADALHISVNTVTTHRRNLVKKLQIHSLAGIVIYAVINGIVDIGDLSGRLP